jgi:hypothetical protein
MSREEEPKLEEINTVTNNVDNNGDQIIHEEQSNRRDEVQTVGANPTNIHVVNVTIHADQSNRRNDDQTEGANTANDVDKDGDLVIHEEQTEETKIKQKELILEATMWIRRRICLFMLNNQIEVMMTQRIPLIINLEHPAYQKVFPTLEVMIFMGIRSDKAVDEACTLGVTMHQVTKNARKTDHNNSFTLTSIDGNNSSDIQLNKDLSSEKCNMVTYSTKQNHSKTVNPLNKTLILI